MSNNTEQSLLSPRLYRPERFHEELGFRTPATSSLIGLVSEHDHEDDNVDDRDGLANISYESSHLSAGTPPSARSIPVATPCRRRSRLLSLSSCDDGMCDDDDMKMHSFRPSAPMIPDMPSPPPRSFSSPEFSFTSSSHVHPQLPPILREQVEDDRSPQVVYVDHDFDNSSDSSLRKLYLSVDSDEEVEDELLVHMPPSLMIKPLSRNSLDLFE
jgi:hypothetical protein